MTREYLPSEEMVRTIERLNTLLEEERVPDPGLGRIFDQMSADARKVIFLLDAVKRGRAAVTAARRDLNDMKAAATTNPENASHAPHRPSEGTQAGNDVSNGIGGSAPEVKKFEFDELPDTQVAASTPAPTDSVPQTEPEKPPDEPGAEPPPPQASAHAPPPEREAERVVVPQPGGVPAVPEHPARPDNSTVKPIETIKKAMYLRNARVGEPYQAAVQIDGLKGLRVDDAGGAGLALEEASGLLKGTPVASGDFQIRLQGLLHGKRAEIVANLAVIPDPKSLWVQKSSDRNDPFWKPDEAFVKLECDLLCAAASKRGRSHAKDGGFRDDDFGLVAAGPGGWHVAAVADGAGSARFSRHGSKVAIENVVNELPGMLEDHVTPHLARLIPAYLQGNPDAGVQIKSQLYQSLATAAFNAARAIEDEAEATGEKASAFSTTLIIGIARKIPEGWFFAGFSVGDGGAAVFDVRDGSLTTLTLPDSGEFAGQTRFLQKSEFAGGFDDVSKRIFFDVRKDFTAMMLMTDGITDPKFPTDAAFADPTRWIEFWTEDLTKSVAFSRSNEDMEKQFLDWLDFWSPGNHDDRTLAVLVP